ncbi:MAG: hypothetical protein JF612_02710 [Planctomycetia bacterium]|nr:hypothetical protein [Planctomycetia bacterium]
MQYGDADTIHIQQQTVSNDDLTHTFHLRGLRVLLMDHEDSRLSAIDFSRLQNCQALEHLRYRGHGVDDDALAEIARLQSLRILNLPRAEFSDAGLPWLEQLPLLEQLRFGTPNVTDAGMKAIRQFPALKRLHLIDVPITDAGLAELSGISQLESLYIDGGHISDAAYGDLFHRRPDLHVHLNQRHHDRDPHAYSH